MGIGISVFLLAVGAILTFAVNVTTKGFNVDTVGIILMVVGGIGLLWALLATSMWRRDDVVVEDAPVRRRRTVVEDV